MFFVVLPIIILSIILYFIVRHRFYSKKGSNLATEEQQYIRSNKIEEPYSNIHELLENEVFQESMQENEETKELKTEETIGGATSNIQDIDTTSNGLKVKEAELSNIDETSPKLDGKSIDDISMIIDIVHNLSFLANDHPELQPLSFIAKQLIDSFTYNDKEDIFMHIESKCSEMFSKGNEHTICYNVLLTIVCLIKKGKTNKEIIDLYIEQYNGQPEERNQEGIEGFQVSEKSEYDTNLNQAKDSRKYTLDYTYGQYIASLAHKHKASLYANTIMRDLLENYIHLENKPSFHDYIISQCNSRIKGNLFLNQESEIGVLNKNLSRKSPSRRPINSSHYKAKELNLSAKSEDSEINEIIGIIEKCASLRIKHMISSGAPFVINTQYNYREYQNDDSWIVFKDFILDKYDGMDQTRFSILYQIIRFVVFERKSGKSAKEIILALKSMSIERLKVYEKEYTNRNSFTAQTKPRNDIIYTPDILRFLSICRRVAKIVKIGVIIKTAEKLSNEYMLLDLDIDFYEFIRQTVHSLPITNDNQGMVRCCFVKFIQNIHKNLTDDELVLLIIKAINKYIQSELSNLSSIFSELRNTDEIEVNKKESRINDNKIKADKEKVELTQKNISIEPSLVDFIGVCSAISNLAHISKKFSKLDKVARDCCKKYNQGKKEISFFSFVCAISFEDKYKGYKEVYQRILKLQKEGLGQSEIIQKLIKERLILLEGMTSLTLLGFKKSENLPKKKSIMKITSGVSTDSGTINYTIKKGFDGAITHLSTGNKIIFSEENLYYNKKSKKTRLNAPYTSLTLTISSLYITRLENLYGIIHCTDSKTRCVVTPVYDKIIYNSIRKGFDLYKKNKKKFISYVDLIK